MTEDSRLLLIAALAIVGLVVLIARFKLPSFLALVVASILLGLCSGKRPVEMAKSFAEGVGGVLGSVAMVIGLGTVLGKILAVSGGAERIATKLIGLGSERSTPWMIAAAAFIIGIPVFFSVGLVLLIPIIFTMAKDARAPFLRFSLPLVAGLSVAHGLVPPHPGALAAVALLKADVGKTILYAVIVGLPTMLVCGPLLGGFLARREKVELGGLAAQLCQASSAAHAPGIGMALFTTLLPVLLMLLATAADLLLEPTSGLRQWTGWVGHPVVAMLIAVLFSFWSLGSTCGLDRSQLNRFSEECLPPLAAILLLVGAGGGFSRVLIDSGVGRVLARMGTNSGISPLLLGWLVAALIRVATGSATVAITTACGLLAPVAASRADFHRELLVLSMGAGSLILSHVNDSGFWMVKEYLNLSVAQTLRTWTVIETAISVVALVLVLLLNLVV